MSIDNLNVDCPTYVAIVVDESGSISTTEANQIRNGLTNFINSQPLTNLTLSLIGMSHNDHNSRTDHIIQKRISDNRQDFLDWINAFGLNQINSQSDYWASGLEVVNNLTVTPDIVIVIADGLQVNNTTILKDLYTDLNKKSHVFVYGVSSINDSIAGWTELTTPLNFYLGSNPVVLTESGSMFTADYSGHNDFTSLGLDLNNLGYQMLSTQIGCTPNVEIIENKLVYPILSIGTKVYQKAGTLTLKNKGRIPLTLTVGTKIHNSTDIDGLVFVLRDTVTIPAKSQIDAVIMVNGTPVSNGTFPELLVLDKVKNPNGFHINFNVEWGQQITINNTTTVLQSPSLNLLAAGSRGNDSTKGIHLRWIFDGELGAKHLPKGDLYTDPNFNFNKSDDFVKVYRSPYVKINNSSNTLSLSRQTPNLVNHAKALWIYKVDDAGRVLYVHFKNEHKYKSITINPLENPALFIQAYGDNLIEIESPKELFFAAELNFSSINSSSILRLETLSVKENTISASKSVSSRKTYHSPKLDAVRVEVENGRSIQFKASSCNLDTINFEFYADFIQYSNDIGSWSLKGKYALSLEDIKVFHQLEPQLNCIHGKWLKFNDGEYVNTQNYMNKWNGITEGNDRNIKAVVNKYIDLSNNKYIDLSNNSFLDNPSAIEPVSFGDAVQIENEDGSVQIINNTTNISNLDLLNIAANDYHIARMLGLGCLDIEEAVFSGEFVYITEYTSFGDLQDGLGAREVHHLSMSIPVSVEKQRFPLPVNINKIEPGLNVDSEGNEPANITDKDGYSHDGKKRYISLFMEDIIEYGSNTPFFESSLEYDGSTFTFPIYAGVDYKIDAEANWRKPELAKDLDYSNVNSDLIISYNEPTPIIIPESQKSFFNVRQEEVGEHVYIYQGYGINIFSRATSGKQISISSNIKPTNTLMAPTGINPLLITTESPLMFTSQVEQDRLETITALDRTYIRLLFEYYSVHELQNYSIPKGLNLIDIESNTNTIYPDSEEIFADYFEVFFRDRLPQIEYAKIEKIEKSTISDITSIVTIKGYTTASTGSEIGLTLNEEHKDPFIGGILTIEDQNYIIQNITNNYVTINGVVTLYLDVEVVNKEIVTSILSDNNATIDSEQIQTIKIPENGLCTLIENMLTLSNWHQPGPLDFKIEYPTNLQNIHREIIQTKGSDGSVDNQLEKTRGIWHENVLIEKSLEKTYQVDENGEYVLDGDGKAIELPETENKHFGLYKLTFTGFQLPQHTQYKGDNIENSVEWFNGIVRLFTQSSLETGNSIPVNSRKEFKVVRTENIGTSNDLVLYISDTNFKLKGDGSFLMDPNYDEIIIGNQTVNYYPSYKVYLFADTTYGLTEDNILPKEGESTHYSIFGIRTHGKSDPVNPANAINYDSKISAPSPMYAVRIEEPEQPKLRKGPLYATRPDFFKRSTYTITTDYKHKPHGVLHYRANDEALLSVLYERETINVIREELKKLGGNNEADLSTRWGELLEFQNTENKVNYTEYPITEEAEFKFRFPLPNNNQLIELINEFIKWHNHSLKLTEEKKVPDITEITALNDVIISTQQGLENDLLAIHFIEQAVHMAFVPLTEVPVIYDFINVDVANTPTYIPNDKKQNIKDKSGHVLKPTDPDFDMAPMMKIVPPTAGSVTAAQFTDFNLDGTSQNIYFYGVREMDIKMNFGEFSPFLGPVKLVPSNPPQSPDIKRMIPVLENPILGINPAIQIELNPYHPEHKIKKINIYRAGSVLDSQSIRTMKLVKEVLIDENILSEDYNTIWTVYDEFEDLESVPFGEGLFYRITVSREIEYAEPNSGSVPNIIIDYAPSQPSKITATIINDAVAPESPTLKASSDPEMSNESKLKPVVFNWEKTVHNGKYHLYKMNSQGNWSEIHDISSNESIVTLPLVDVDPYTDELIIKTDDDERIYHHFKIIAENSSGMYSSEEKILTL